MMYQVYIIYSASLDRFYTGTCADFASRLVEHNTGQYEKSFSSRGIPWVEYLVIGGLGSEQAYSVERHIKRMKSKTYISNLKKYPDMLSGLVARFGSPVQPR